MNEITVGVLTISDRCHRKEAVDESGPTLVKLIEDGIIKKGKVVKTHLVPDCKDAIAKLLKDWCSENIDLILTTGGTGLSERDVTPEATEAVLERSVVGITQLIFKESSRITSLAALSRGLAGTRGRSLIVNFPGSKKACKECLEAIASVIPHAVDLIQGREREVEKIHTEAEKKKSTVLEDRVSERISSYALVSVENAQKIIAEKVNLLKREQVIDYRKALGHVLAQEVIALDDHPSDDVSLKDGYAMRSIDGRGEKIVLGVSNAGDLSENKCITPNGCVRVSTGGRIPPGADCVVEVEKTEVVLTGENGESRIKLSTHPIANSDVRKKGSDYSRGSILLNHGTYLDSAAVGLLSAAGITSVRVFRKPIVAIMSTGDEVVNPHENLKTGQVRDSNRILLMGLLQEENIETIDLGIVADKPDLLRDSLEKGFRSADIVVTTGSMSMGQRDYMKEIFIGDFKGEIYFGRINMKPGKPTCCGLVNFEGKPKLWFGLPGNPASAFVTSHLFLLPAVRKISGRTDVFPPSTFISKLENCPCLEDRPQYARAFVKYNEDTKEYTAVITENQRSSWIGSCVNVNGLVLIPSRNAASRKITVLMIGKHYITA